ncbi:MAG: AAA family ATPase [Bacteroidetes bacterium]|nr:AAA family ATPase [Bacteroidota bacterium]
MLGLIKKAKIDLSKYVVLIGPQGSGKSIIAKLIAIFQNDLNPGKIFNSFDSLILKFGLNSFFTIESKIFFSTPFFLTIFQQNEITIEIHKDIYEKYFNETDVKNESKRKN